MTGITQGGSHAGPHSTPNYSLAPPAPADVVPPFPCPQRRRDTVTHQVHDEVQLDGEVHDKEDTGPGVPGVGRHHHVWETAFAEHCLGALSACLHLF